MKKFTSFLLVFALVLSLTACGNTGKTETETETITAENTTEADTLSESSQDMQVSYPITLVDQLDRNVTIEKEPQTIVSAYYISTSLLLALGQQDKLVGVEAKADTRSIYQLGAPSIIELPNVGTAKEFDLETCASLNPDLVVLPAKLKDVIPALEELGLTVLAVNPEDQELLEEAIGLLSTAVNQVEHATELLTFTKDSLTQLEADLRGTKEAFRILGRKQFFLIHGNPWHVPAHTD